MQQIIVKEMTTQEDIPAFLKGNVLVPLKIDVTYNGARLVDTFSWNLYNSCMTIDEFALMTCVDLNLSNGFQEKIKQPLAEELLFGKLVHGGEVAVHIKDGAPNFEVTPAAPKATKPKPPKKKVAKKASKAE